MSVSKQTFSNHVRRFQFRELFNDMGWNNDRTQFQPITVQDQTFTFQAIAEKSGFKIVLCSPAKQGAMPDYATRKVIEKSFTKLFQEHLIIFCNAQKTEQIWQLVVRQSGKPTKVTETRWNSRQDPELLYQRAAGLFFELDEEENITIVDVTQRIVANFHQNSEQVTRRFYDRFKREHTAFLGFINGIKDTAHKDWYASLMLNRLMFCYFIQKKGFLDSNKNYLRDKLNACRDKKNSAEKNKGNFYSFYRNFLLVLFHGGLNEPKQTPEVKVEIGNVPYLNGGLFDEHELEKNYASIAIADEAFERLFDFFDEYEWHLDTRITATGRDINPDVIGYIFEKYINDRAQMGAYYTKEDITEYIAKNCILPYLFDETQRHCPKAFAPEAALWAMMRESGDAYIYDAVKHGINPDKLWGDVPPEIHAGFDEDLAKALVNGQPDGGKHLWQLRKEWNKPAPSEIGLPTEIWREVIERRKRYETITSAIKSGNVAGINDFITYNLNIRQFAQDAIENTADPEFLKHFYKALTTVTILDPTCGSGAFLFAAMNILEPLYEACLQRMENFVADSDKGKHKFFEEVLAHVKSPEHPNLQYFIYKSIILRNLHGVDIMKEAVEIAKLRLFLKLVATVEPQPRKPNMGLEPLPDIDFNIRAGNALVGFATEAELHAALDAELNFGNEAETIKERCDVVARAYSRYKEIQLGAGDDDAAAFKQAKDELNTRLQTLNKELSRLLHKESNKTKHQEWLASHQPFHWFAEFYEIIHDKGGFDVVIGNPPYVESRNVSYQLNGYSTAICGNLYPILVERILQLLQRFSSVGVIIPVASISADGMIPMQKILINQMAMLYVSSFNDRPSKLFENLEHIRLSIIIGLKNLNQKNIYATKYNSWYNTERDKLFNSLKFENATNAMNSTFIPKIDISKENSILQKIFRDKPLQSNFQRIGAFKIYYTRKLSSFVQILDFVPTIFDEKNNLREPSELNHLSFASQEALYPALCSLNSNLFYWYLRVFSDCRNLNKREINSFPFDTQKIAIEGLSIMASLGRDLMKDIQVNSEERPMRFAKIGLLKIQCTLPKKSKSIIDQIDTVLAEHYGFTEEELDFIINYDIKYRMGSEADEEE